jgi:amidase
LCATLGHHVEEARPKFDSEALGHAFRIIVGANVCMQLEARAAALGRTLAATDVEQITWSHAMVGRTQTAADYARSIGVFHATGRRLARFFANYDVLLSPTMCQLPYPIGVLDMANEDGDAFLAAILASIGFTSLFNSTGNPAISLPLGWSNASLPIGVQFAARFGDEATLLRLAAQLETAQPWAERRAPPAKTG